jgi:hypothetical protein
MTSGARQASWLTALFSVTFVVTWLIQVGPTLPRFPADALADVPAAGGPRAAATERVTMGDPAEDPGRRLVAASRDASSATLPGAPARVNPPAVRDTSAALDGVAQLLLATQDRGEKLTALQDLAELARSGAPARRVLELVEQLRGDPDPEVAAFASYKYEEVTSEILVR